MHRITLTVIALSSLLFGAVPANAHAYLAHATPAAGSAVATAPKELLLWFTEKLEPAFSTIEVRKALWRKAARVMPDICTECRNALE